MLNLVQPHDLAAVRFIAVPLASPEHGPMNPPSNASRRAVMLFGAVSVVTVALLPYDLVLLLDPDDTPPNALLQLHASAAAVALVVALVAIVTGAHQVLAASVLVGSIAGAFTGLVLALITGTGFGAELNGLVFRVIAAAIVGAIAGVAVLVFSGIWASPHALNSDRSCRDRRHCS